MGLPRDPGRAEGAQYEFHDQEENDNLEGRQGRNSRDWEKQGHTVPREESAVGAERREDPRRSPDQQDRSGEVDEDEAQRSNRASREKQNRPPEGADPLLERRRDQDETQEVQEDVELRRVDELEGDPRPRSGQVASEESQAEIPHDPGRLDESEGRRGDLEGVHREDCDRIYEGERRLPDERIPGREDNDGDGCERRRPHVPPSRPKNLRRVGNHTNLSRIRAIFSAAWPSPNDFDFVPAGLNFSSASRMSSGSDPTSAFQPSSTVSIHSVSSRSVMHGTPKK